MRLRAPTPELAQSCTARQVVERSLLARLADGTYVSRGVQQLSGGQWRRLSLSLTLAFAQVTQAVFQQTVILAGRGQPVLTHFKLLAACRQSLRNEATSKRLRLILF